MLLLVEGLASVDGYTWIRAVLAEGWVVMTFAKSMTSEACLVDRVFLTKNFFLQYTVLFDIIAFT